MTLRFVFASSRRSASRRCSVRAQRPARDAVRGGRQALARSAQRQTRSCSRPRRSRAARKLMRRPRATSRAAATWSGFASASRGRPKRSPKAAEAAEIANVTLASLIKTRADATNANAATFAAQLWTEAGERFDSAARRLETGDIRGARSRADEAEALYRDAELTAIKAQYLSQTRALLAEAEQARVPRSRRSTYEKARSLLAEAERELSENRYDTDLPRSLAQQANYEARHAIYLAGLIERMRDENRSLEDMILSYEEPLSRSAQPPTRSCSSTRASSPSSRISSRTSKGCASEPRKAQARPHRHARARRRSRGRDPRSRRAARRRVAGTRGARAEARGRGADSRAVRDDREHVRARRGARLARRQPHGHPARRPHVPERPGRRAAGVSGAAREGAASSGRVPALADRDRGPHGLVRRRRERTSRCRDGAPRPSARS